MPLTMSDRRTVNWMRVGGAGLIAVGLVLLVAGLIGSTGADFLVDEVSYLLSGGVGGLFCVVVGSAVVISSDVRVRCQTLVSAGSPLGDEARPSGSDGQRKSD